MGARTVPETFNRTDWPRLAAQAINTNTKDILRLTTALNPMDYGAKGDGIADDTIPVQRTVDAVNSSPYARSLFAPGDCVFRTTAPITSAIPLRITGEGVSPYVGMLNTGGDVRGSGSWFFLDHSGKGFVFSDTGPTSGVQIEGIGTFRPQPAPVLGWAPNDHDFDFYFRSVEYYMHDVCMLNATRGIMADQGNYGKPSLSHIRGQFFKIGACFDKQYDVVMVDGFRCWGYWADDANVQAYTKANLDTLYFLRCDNPQIDNIFSIEHRSGIRIGQSAGITGYPGGTTTKLKVGQADCDIGKFGLWIDNTVSGASVQMGNFSAQCDGISGSNPVMLDNCSGCIVDISNADLRLSDENAIRNAGTGTGNIVRAGIVTVNGYNGAAGAFPAFEASAGNTIRLGMHPEVSGGGGAAVSGGAGTLVIP